MHPGSMYLHNVYKVISFLFFAKIKQKEKKKYAFRFSHINLPVIGLVSIICAV